MCRIHVTPKYRRRIRCFIFGSMSSVEVLVNFTPRYNVRVHRIPPHAGFTPRLYSCLRVHGELYMVLMEYFPSENSVVPQGSKHVSSAVALRRRRHSDLNAA
ncbi:uncharacterized protein PHACADRAFT_258877 [Phanerochaete carnosa HHB-10118-sp]|uniref:Uncharacterized protein n=1 Tax=Phanerochaete carnosa (strain HHB-10118-sp) TaxID=650164 RepID=K5W6M9_PHACS|nr:uncharacterized protein PHACADRAFT_258877 [Phanerochaete carnosa HHB-10118-sp]EKM54785.1 hypothetical protein PHACADRAFT_258877 [Phanerochaete carnosa HHB-10118-sp]